MTFSSLNRGSTQSYLSINLFNDYLKLRCPLGIAVKCSGRVWDERLWAGGFKRAKNLQLKEEYLLQTQY